MFHHSAMHLGLRDLKKPLPKGMDIVITVRNPWERLVSLWKMFITSKRTRPRDKNISFKDFVLYRSSKPYYHRPAIYSNSWFATYTNRQKILAKYIIRFECFEESAQAFFRERYGEEAIIQHFNKFSTVCGQQGASDIHYRELYDAEMIEITTKWYQQDIDNLNYFF